MSQTAHLPRFPTVAAFDAWHETQPERWELHDGVPVAMPPEHLGHVRTKALVWAALREAIRGAGLSCEAVMDGLAVSVPGLRQFIPDATVICGERLDGAVTRTDAPVVVVEVLSPATAERDHGVKLEGYFALPSVQHYLIVSPGAAMVIHHRRAEGGELRTRLHHAGPITLDPPGIAVAVEAFYEDAMFRP